MLHNAYINLLTVIAHAQQLQSVSYMGKLIPAHSTHSSPVRRGLLW